MDATVLVQLHPGRQVDVDMPTFDGATITRTAGAYDAIVDVRGVDPDRLGRIVLGIQGHADVAATLTLPHATTPEEPTE